MKSFCIAYHDIDIQFQILNYQFSVLNLVHGRVDNAIPLHSHGENCYEIHYNISGTGDVQIDDVNYAMAPGMLYVTGPHIKHAQISSDTDPMMEYCVFIKVEKTKVPGVRKKETPRVLALLLDTTVWMGAASEEIKYTLEQLFYEMADKPMGYTIQVESLLKLLMIHLVRHYDNSQKPTLHYAKSNLSEGGYLVMDEYFLYRYSDCSLEELSSMLGLSMRQTERVLKEHYGKTFLQKKTEARMSAASILLSDNSRTITRIADELGYSSVEHFSTAFRKYYGESPRSWRKNRP